MLPIGLPVLAIGDFRNEGSGFADNLSAIMRARLPTHWYKRENQYTSSELGRGSPAKFRYSQRRSVGSTAD